MRFLLLSFFLACGFGLFAQDELTLERVWGSDEFRADRFGSVDWMITEDAYIRRNDGNFEKVRPGKSKGKVMVSKEDLTREGEEKPMRFQSHQWSNDYSKLLLFTNTKRVWRANTKGDYWLLDRKSGELTQLGKDLPESSLMFAKLSPDHQSVAYVSAFNVYVEDLQSGGVRRLTTDGTEDIINGTFDWVYEEEFSCRDGFRWSPDGKYIAFWQLDASKIRDFYMINNTDSLYPFVVPVQYPKVGEDPSRCRVATVNVESGDITWMDIPGDQVQNYIPRMQWLGDELIVQQLNRKQQHLRFWKCDPATGKARKIYEERDEAYIEVLNNDFSANRRGMVDMDYIPSTNELLHITEKDGWKHVYAIKVDGSGERLVTIGEYDISSINSVLVDQNLMYFMASPDNATQRYLYSVHLTDGSAPKRVTPAEFSGVNSYSISANGKYALHNTQNVNRPRDQYLIKLPGHAVVKQVADNSALFSKVTEMGFPQPEFIQVEGNGQKFDVRILKPSNFDSSKKYPVIFYVYGEPWGQTCTDTWGFGYDNVLAEMGYLVMTVDNRGTPCPRGREWRKSCYRQLGRINIADQAEAAKEVAKLPYVDASRMGVWGWSGGGTSTLNLLFQHPDVYSTGIAVAPVADLLMYDNIYQERYMGLPQENREDYVAGSAVTHAKNLEGNLLVIHGTADDNVHYQATELLINELVKHGKMFDMMSYPNRSHGIWEGEGTTMHLYNTMINYWEENMEPGPSE